MKSDTPMETNFFIDHGELSARLRVGRSVYINSLTISTASLYTYPIRHCPNRNVPWPIHCDRRWRCRHSRCLFQSKLVFRLASCQSWTPPGWWRTERTPRSSHRRFRLSAPSAPVPQPPGPGRCYPIFPFLLKLKV